MLCDRSAPRPCCALCIRPRLSAHSAGRKRLRRTQRVMPPVATNATTSSKSCRDRSRGWSARDRCRARSRRAPNCASSAAEPVLAARRARRARCIAVELLSFTGGRSAGAAFRILESVAGAKHARWVHQPWLRRPMRCSIRLGPWARRLITSRSAPPRSMPKISDRGRDHCCGSAPRASRPQPSRRSATTARLPLCRHSAAPPTGWMPPAARCPAGQPLSSNLECPAGDRRRRGTTTSSDGAHHPQALRALDVLPSTCSAAPAGAVRARAL